MRVYFTLRNHKYFPIQLRDWERESVGNFISYDGARFVLAGCYFTNEMAEQDCTAFILKFGNLVNIRTGYV